MSDADVNFVDKSLQMLLQAGRDYPDANLDFSVAYISAVGVSLLQPLLRTTGRKRAVVGLAPINRLNAFLKLQDLDVEVYVYVAEPRRVFHPKIYYGATNGQSWAMIGSSNLTQNGLSFNVERNLFIVGQRHMEPFSSIETQLDTFRAQAYPFDSNIQKTIDKIEKSSKVTEEKYTKN
jgi:HKD family nuclease